MIEVLLVEDDATTSWRLLNAPEATGEFTVTAAASLTE